MVLRWLLLSLLSAVCTQASLQSQEAEVLDIIRDDVLPNRLPASTGHKMSLANLDKHPDSAKTINSQSVGWGWRMLPVGFLGIIIATRLPRWMKSGTELMTSWRQLAPQAVECFLACAVYLVSGPTLIILNKYIMTTLAFPYPIMVANLGLVSMLVVTQVVVRSGVWPLKQAKIERNGYLYMALPLAVFGSSSLILGNWVYLYLSVPLVQILKSFTVVYVMLLGFTFGLERCTTQLIMAVVVIVVGLVLSVSHDINISTNFSGTFVFGIFVMTSANLSEAGRSIFTQLSVERWAFMDAMFWCTPTMVVLNSMLVALIEMRGLRHETFNGHLMMCLLGSSLLGGVTNFANFWLTKLVGSLTMKVMVNSRNILLVLVSVIAFGEPCTAMQYLGYSIALTGLAIYDDAKCPCPAEARQERAKLNDERERPSTLSERKSNTV